MGLNDRGLADTSFFIANESGRSMRRSDVPAYLAVSMITIGELRSGVLAARTDTDRSARVATLLSASDLDPFPVDHEVARCWADLRQAMASTGQRMPLNDAWIAATAMAHRLPVVTQDDDFDVDVPGLEVIKV